MINPECLLEEYSEEPSEVEFEQPSDPVTRHSQETDDDQAVELHCSRPQEPASDQSEGPSCSPQSSEEEFMICENESECNITRPVEKVCDLSDNGQTKNNDVAENSIAEVSVTEEQFLALEEQYFELKKKQGKLRDQLTDAEVDKLELSKALSSREELCVDHVKQINDLKKEVKYAEDQASSSSIIIRELRAKLQASENQIADLQEKLQRHEVCSLSLEQLKSNESLLKFYTGLLQSTASCTFERWLYYLYVTLGPLIVWPDRETLIDTMPPAFTEAFGKHVAVIIDCFEVFTEKPGSLDTRAMTWSNYKHHNTVKFLIGITPCGAISFISETWGGRVSDKHLTAQSGLYENLLPGDVVMADRGFTISEDLGFYCAKLLMPAFTRGQAQLSSHDISDTRKIASLRIHVERVIGLVRRKYRILQSVLPTDSLVKKSGHDVSQIDEIVGVCCALTNICNSVVVT